MVTQLPCNPSIIDEYETRRWYDGLGLYVVALLALLIFLTA